MPDTAILLASLQSVVLEHDLLGEDGTLLAPKGTRVFLSPQVLAKTVFVEDGRSVEACLNGMREMLAQYQGELVRVAAKFAETELAKMGGEE